MTSIRNVPTGLAAHLATGGTSVCQLVKIILADGSRLAFTTTNGAVQYDDGTDVLTYLPTNGVALDRLESNSELSIDNTELYGWVDGVQITQQQVRNGLFRNARIVVYTVNYLDPGAGHVLEASGYAGEPTVSENGWRVEFRSKTQKLKQPITEAWSITCRRKFGDPVCGKAFVWTPHTVTAVSVTDPDLQFTATGITAPDGTYRYGVLRFTSGANVGFEVEIENQVGSTLTLMFPTPNPIQIGDNFEPRIDCDQRFVTCRDVHNNVAKFDGEPHIPIADSDANAVPGAQTPTADSGGG